MGTLDVNTNFVLAPTGIKLNNLAYSKILKEGQSIMVNDDTVGIYSNGEVEVNYIYIIEKDAIKPLDWLIAHTKSRGDILKQCFDVEYGDIICTSGECIHPDIKVSKVILSTNPRLNLTKPLESIVAAIIEIKNRQL